MTPPDRNNAPSRPRGTPRLVQRAIAGVALACAFVFGASHAAGQTAADAGPSPDAELFVQIQALDRQLTSPAGVQFRAMLDGLGLFSRTGESWRALAGALGLTPEDAIGALLSGRVLLLADGLEHADRGRDGLRWACAMTIDPAFGSEVPRLLKGAPRASLGGRTVFAIEDGRLSVMPVAGGAVLVVSTAGADALLRAAADLAVQKPARADRVGTGGVLVLRRDDGSAVTGTVHPTADGWDLRCSFVEPAIARPIGGASSLEPPELSTRIDAGWFERTTANAAIAYAGPIAPEPEEAPPAGESGLIGLGLLGTDPANLRKWTGIFMPVQPPVSFLRGDSDFGVLASGPGAVSSAWLRVPDLRAAARAGDAHVCDLLGDLGGAAAVSLDAPECTGGYPGAARRVSLPGRGSSAGDETIFAWGVSSVRSLAGPPQSWWAMHAVPAEHPAPPLAPRLSADPEDPEVRFTLRPRLLIDRLAAPGGTPSPVVAPRGLGEIARLRLVDWSLTPSPVPGFPAAGHLRVRFHIPPGE
jgi:hypothetical protein